MRIRCSVKARVVGLGSSSEEESVGASTMARSSSVGGGGDCLEGILRSVEGRASCCNVELLYFLSDCAGLDRNLLSERLWPCIQGMNVRQGTNKWLLQCLCNAYAMLTK